MNATWVFISISEPCGHAQSVYADCPQDGVSETEPWASAILGDLRAGLTVKRITIEDWLANYVKRFMCGCPTVGKENERLREKAAASNDRPLERVDWSGVIRLYDEREGEVLHGL